MKGKMKTRVMAVFMALLMTISLLPADFLGGRAVEVLAAETTYTFTPADIQESDKAPNGSDIFINPGTYKTAFTLESDRWRYYDDRLDGGKSNNCKLTYTVQTTGATGTLTIVISAAGDNKNSVIKLTDGAGNPVVMSDGNTEKTLTNSTQTTLTWENLTQADGTYTLSSTTDKMRVYSVTATERTSTTTYTLTPADIQESDKAPNGSDIFINSGTYKTAFTLESDRWRYYGDRLDGGKSNNCKLTYTVQTTGATGTLTVVISAAGDNKNSVIKLTNGAGNPVVMSDGNAEKTLTNSTQTTLTWENLTQADGPYTLSSTTDKMRVYSVTATESTATSVVTAPVVSTASVSQSDATVTISGTGTAGSDGSKYVIVRVSDGGEEKTVGTTDGAADTFSIVDTLTASGTYTYKVYGKGTTNSTEVVATGTATYILPLAKATVTATGDNAKVVLSWGAVPEATSYDVKVYEGTTELTDKSLTGLTTTSATIEGLTNGKEYGFVVVTRRTTPVAETESTKVTAKPVAPEAGVTWLKGDLLARTSAISAEMQINERWSMTKGVAVDTITDNNADVTYTASDGQSFTQKISFSGSGKIAEKSLKLTLTEDSYIIVYANHGGSAGTIRTLNIATDDGTSKGKVVNTISISSKNETMVPSAPVELKAGTYYLYSASSGINIYAVKVGEGAAPRAEWSTVANPVINNVTRSEDGKLTVDFTASFGGDGADDGYVIMYQNGNEAASAVIVSDADVTFTPSNDGTYTFKVIIKRDGEADKESEVYTFNNYQLAPEKPSITWVNNLGNGSVYVDYNNITTPCATWYKSENDVAFIKAAENVTAGNYTFTGLTPGVTYDFKITASDERGTSESKYEGFTVGEPVQQWYADLFGSATSGTMTINGEVRTLKAPTDAAANYTYPSTAPNVTNDNNGTVVIAPSTNGKVADSEEGIQIYYTKINPNTENFKITATFTVNDDLDPSTINNQSAYGIFAIDTQGIGNKNTKYFNSVSVGQFKSGTNGLYHANCARLITGYESYDTTSTAGSGRVLNNANIFSKQTADDSSKVGDTYTYTLEKTNTGFIASMEGCSDTIIFDDVKNLMVQEDGSIVVGVAAARVGVEISNIKFEKTSGGADAVEVVTKIEPKITVFSSSVSGSTDYEFIATPNVDGWLDVYNFATNEYAYQGPVYADKIVKVPVTLKTGYSEIKYAFKASDAVPNLTTYGIMENIIRVTVQQWGAEGETIYVSPNASTGGAGTKENPLDLQTALNYAQPGQTIVLLDGTYYIEKDLVIPRSVNGTADKPITLTAENVGSVTIDGSKMLESSSLISLVGSYWKMYGIEFTNGLGKGISVCGNYNTVEMCTIHNVGNSGLQISRYAGEPDDQGMWPSYNLIKYCEAYDCCDPGRSDADGFAAKLTCGEGNKFYGCISHHNIDDGWDLYAKSTTGPIGVVTIENCVAYSNGFLTTDNPATMSASDFGEGNGFKLGGENMPGAHVLMNSISYNNAGKGITSNSGPDCKVYNCTAYNNSLKGGSYNVSLYTKSSNPKAWVLDGMLSVVDNDTTEPELGKDYGVVNSLRSATNYLYDGKKSVNTQGVQATSAWFVSTDITLVPTITVNGIDMHGLLELRDQTINAGAKFTSWEISTKPEATMTVSAKNVVGFIGPAPAPVNSVNTGDTTPLMPLIIIMLVSAGICVAYVFRRKRA